MAAYRLFLCTVRSHVTGETHGSPGAPQPPGRWPSTPIDNTAGAAGCLYWRRQICVTNLCASKPAGLMKAKWGSQGQLVPTALKSQLLTV